MILDGNSFNSRLPTFLSSGSLIFRAGLFGEWFDERIHPLKHYLPVLSRPFCSLRATTTSVSVNGRPCTCYSSKWDTHERANGLDFGDLRARLDWAETSGPKP